ncbi:nucleic acid-binding, OB-fold protein [Tanacetum coccineum]
MSCHFNQSSAWGSSTCHCCQMWQGLLEAYESVGKRRVDFPMLRYRLELDVFDDTTQTMVVMFDEIATALVGCSVGSLMDIEDEYADGHVSLPPAISNLIGTTHVMEIKSHSYYEYGSFESFTCWQINMTEGGEDSVTSSTLDTVADVQTPKLKRLVHYFRLVIEYFDAEASGDLSGCVGENKVDPLSDNKRMKRVLIDDSTRDVSYGTPEDSNTDRAGDRSDTKKGSWDLDHSMAQKMDRKAVLRRLGSIFTSVYAAVQKLKKDSWKELQFSLVDNSKLNVVYLLNRS